MRERRQRHLATGFITRQFRLLDCFSVYLFTLILEKEKHSRLLLSRFIYLPLVLACSYKWLFAAQFVSPLRAGLRDIISCIY